MKMSGLTERRMSDKRFRRSEQAILIAYFTIKDYPSVKKLASIAHISRSTLYRHHRRIHAIPIEYEEFLLRNYTKSINKLLKNKAEIRIIFLRTLVFISNHKTIFIILLRGGHNEAVKKMIELLKARVVEEWHLGGDIDKIYSIYQHEILGIIEIWSKQKFTARQLESTLKDILYLTSSARRNLLPLQ